MKDRLQFPDVIDVDEIGPIIREQVLNRQLVCTCEMDLRKNESVCPGRNGGEKAQKSDGKTRAARPIIGCDKWRKPLCILLRHHNGRV